MIAAWIGGSRSRACVVDHLVLEGHPQVGPDPDDRALLVGREQRELVEDELVVVERADDDGVVAPAADLLEGAQDDARTRAGHAVAAVGQPDVERQAGVGADHPVRDLLVLDQDGAGTTFEHALSTSQRYGDRAPRRGGGGRAEAQPTDTGQRGAPASAEVSDGRPIGRAAPRVRRGSRRTAVRPVPSGRRPTVPGRERRNRTSRRDGRRGRGAVRWGRRPPRRPACRSTPRTTSPAPRGRRDDPAPSRGGDRRRRACRTPDRQRPGRRATRRTRAPPARRPRLRGPGRDRRGPASAVPGGPREAHGTPDSDPAGRARRPASCPTAGCRRAAGRAGSRPRRAR